LADLPELVGFFSYSREDDEGSNGALSELRQRIREELRAQLGLLSESIRLWQDQEAIAPGTHWQEDTQAAIAQSVCFIPIITPTVIKSPDFKFELDAFLVREQELGRTDLVFPILYIRIPSLEDNSQSQSNPVLSLIAERHPVDWRQLRYRGVNSTEAKEEIAKFCEKITGALQKPQVPPQDERKEEAQQTTEEQEHQSQQVEADRGSEKAKSSQKSDTAGSLFGLAFIVMIVALILWGIFWIVGNRTAELWSGYVAGFCFVVSIVSLFRT
jgi:hypothetical protein